MKFLFVTLISVTCFFHWPLLAAPTLVPSHKIKLKSWAELRDQRVVKQQFDYSCGASSLATILTHYYNRPTEELEILKILGNEGASSFKNLADAAKQLGYKSFGFAASLAQLKRLKVPAILYFYHRKQDHFLVLVGWEGDHFILADPTWGNIQMNEDDFLLRWETRAEDDRFGRVLVVLPNKDTKLTPLLKSLPKIEVTMTDHLRFKKQ